MEGNTSMRVFPSTKVWPLQQPVATVAPSGRVGAGFPVTVTVVPALSPEEQDCVPYGSPRYCRRARRHLARAFRASTFSGSLRAHSISLRSRPTSCNTVSDALSKGALRRRNLSRRHTIRTQNSSTDSDASGGVAGIYRSSRGGFRGDSGVGCGRWNVWLWFMVLASSVLSFEGVLAKEASRFCWPPVLCKQDGSGRLIRQTKRFKVSFK